MSRYLLLIIFFSLFCMPGCLHLGNQPADTPEAKVADPETAPVPTVETVRDMEIITLSDSEPEDVDASAKLQKENNYFREKVPVNYYEDPPSEKERPKGPYTLNIGDVVEISVLDEPEMTRDITVIPDGSITYLLVGEMQAEGLTIAELRKNLTVALEEFFIAPYVSIITKKLQIPDDEIRKVSILGAVKNSGNFDWHKGDRILDLISESGGLLYTQTELGARTTANLKASYVSRNGRELDVDLYKLIRVGDMRQNILLHPDDFIYIADSEESNIIIMGEVREPKIVPYTRNMTVVEALSICQGFTREAYQSRVVILRTSPDGEAKYVEVDVNDLLHGRDVKNLMLEGGDIVYVPEQTLSEYARWAGFLVDIANLVLKGYEVREAVRFPKLNRHTSSD